MPSSRTENSFFIFSCTLLAYRESWPKTCLSTKPILKSAKTALLAKSNPAIAPNFILLTLFKMASNIVDYQNCVPKLNAKILVLSPAFLLSGMARLREIGTCKGVFQTKDIPAEYRSPFGLRVFP